MASLDPPTATAAYLGYDAGVAASMQGISPYLVFFHAEWCPPCVTWDEMITAALPDLPGDITILKADYDNDTAVRRRFGITANTSVVFVNPHGQVAKTVIAPKLKQVTDFFAQYRL